MRYTRNIFLKNYNKVDDRPTDIQDLCIYETSRRIKRQHFIPFISFRYHCLKALSGHIVLTKYIFEDFQTFQKYQPTNRPTNRQSKM